MSESDPPWGPPTRHVYNQRPTWLANARTRIYRAVSAAYGWPEDIEDEDVLKNLLALNQGRPAARS
jgi:hypothetical protein